jgi:regulator of sigma E protease
MRDTPGPVEAVTGGVTNVWNVAKLTVTGLYYMVNGDLSRCGVTGPVRIAKVAAASAADGIDDFIGLLALLSAAIGFMNLFPIPVLDGGHLVFYAYEAVTRRKPGGVVLTILNAFGLSVILTLLLFGLFNDFTCN